MNEKQFLKDGYRKYEGQEIDVFFNTDICIHSGNCVKTNPAVFEVKRKPWIIADADSASNVAKTIDLCPSGALQYVRKD